MKIDGFKMLSTEYSLCSVLGLFNRTEKNQGSEIGHWRQINEKAAVFFYY